MQIWAEGYAATGESGGASCMGNSSGKTLQEACDRHFGDNSYYNSLTLSYWGCKLYDNESDARRRFG
jgi:hypothetical protein